jgi:hypothetical protein
MRAGSEASTQPTWGTVWIGERHIQGISSSTAESNARGINHGVSLCPRCTVVASMGEGSNRELSVLLNQTYFPLHALHLTDL